MSASVATAFERFEHAIELRAHRFEPCFLAELRIEHFGQSAVRVDEQPLDDLVVVFEHPRERDELLLVFREHLAPKRGEPTTDHGDLFQPQP